MGMHDEMSRVIEAAYEAAVDPSCWSDWAWRVTALFGGVCGSLHIINREGWIEHQTIRHEDMTVVERYLADGIACIDPQIPYAARHRANSVYADTDHIDPEDPPTGEYISWARSNAKMRHYVTAITPLPGGERLAGLSIHLGAEVGPISLADRELMGWLLPHFARAVTLGLANAEKLTQAYLDGVVQFYREPCALLATNGRVLHTTAAMEGLLAAKDGLDCRNGRLFAMPPNETDLIELVVATALSETRRISGSYRVARPSGRRNYVLNVTPLPRNERFPLPTRAAALVVIVDPEWQHCALPDRWRQAFTLSARESEIATLLLGGHSVGSVAERLRISVATARVHLRNVFAKTGVTRQSELIRLLSRCS